MNDEMKMRVRMVSMEKEESTEPGLMDERARLNVCGGRGTFYINLAQQLARRGTMITIRPGSQTSKANPCMISGSGANDNYIDVHSSWMHYKRTKQRHKILTPVFVLVIPW